MSIGNHVLFGLPAVVFTGESEQFFAVTLPCKESIFVFEFDWLLSSVDRNLEIVKGVYFESVTLLLVRFFRGVEFDLAFPSV